MNKEEIHELMTEMELKREISKLKLEIKRKNKIIQRLKEKLKKGR